MMEIEEDICCSKTKFIVGKGVLNELTKITEKKVIIFSNKIDKSILNEIVDDKTYMIEVNDGESFKNLNSVIYLIKKFLEIGIDRGDYVVGVGGGSLLDTVSFASSIYLRGVNLVNVPTTLLGMVDAAIGGKNGVNFENYKNIIGTFYQPRLIISDLRFLDSLPIEELKKGLAEVIKYALVLDKELYDFLSLNKEEILNKEESAIEEVIYRSALNKLKIVKEDEREEKGVRIVLNFGHTIGHAIEAGSNFSVPHGYAISVGMLCETKIAEEMGISEEGVVEDVVWLLSLYDLPYLPEKLGVKINLEVALEAISKDKKVRNDYVLMPFPVRIGSWKSAKVPIETIKGFAKQCLSGEGE
ncbi:MAG: 3-dehydroquinate synthase [Sulfolobaceae archaeon]